MLNHIIVMGRLVKDPELRQTNNGISVATFTVAVDRDYGEDKSTDFIPCVAWRGTGEFVSKYFSKGQMAVVSGRLQNRTWEKDGVKHTTSEIIADNVYFGQAKTTQAAAGDQSWTETDMSESDLPF